MSDYTRTSPAGGGAAIPNGATEVGGIVIDLIGLNGARITVQIPASSLFSGYSYSNYQVIGVQGGFSSATIAALGGGIQELAVRLTLYDGDTSPGNFDFGDVTLLVEGVGIGSLSGQTERTDSAGNSLGLQIGFGDEALNTGWFHVSDQSILSQIYAGLVADGSLSVAIQDIDAGDNFYDFTAGVDGGLVNVGQPPNVAPILDNPIPDFQSPEDLAINVQIASNAFSDPEGSTLSYSATLSDDSPLPAWLAFDAGTRMFAGTPPLNFNGSLSLKVTASDGLAATSDTFILEVTPVNDAPVANDDTVALDEDTTADFNVLANDTDVDGDTLMVTGVTQGAHGAVSVNANNTIHYVPVADYSGPDSFEYTISDGAIARTATVNVTVRAVNDPPYAFDDTATVEEDGSVAIFVTANDTDADNQPPNIAHISTPGHGSVQLNGDNSITYTPDADFSGIDTFTYTVNDDQGRGAFGESTATVTVTVTGVNDAPVNGVPGGQTMLEDTTLVFSTANGNALSVSDVDVGGGTMTVTLAATHGTLSLSGTAGLTFATGDGSADATMTFDGTAAAINAALQGLAYAPDANYFGSADLTITTNDNGNTGTGGALQDADTVAITVASVNDAPSGTDKTLTLLEDGSVTIAASDFGFGDIDGNSLSGVKITTLPGAGTLTLNGGTVSAGDAITLAQLNANQLVFTPAADANGSGYASLTFQVQDDGGTANGGIDLDQSPNTLIFDVTAVNDAPQLDNLIPDQASAEDTFFSYQVPANTFSDVDGDALTYTATRANGNPLPAWLVFNPATRAFSGTPPLDYNGSINVKVTASDGSLSASDVFVLTITPVDDPGIARTDRFTINDTGMVDGNVFADNGAGPDIDVDNILQVGAVLRGAAAVGADYVLPSGAMVRIDTDGHILYTPGPAQAQLAAPGSGAVNTSYVDTFSYSLVNGGTADVIVTVQGTDGYDTLLGTNGVDSLHGGMFDDVLIGGLGADMLDGGDGNDTASYAGDPGGVFVNLTLGQGYANSSFGDTYTSIENVTGTDFNDFLIGDTGVNVLDGGAGNDTIIGGLGPDVLIGGSGIDTLSYEDNSGTVFVNLLTGMGFNNAAQGDTYSGFENVIGGLFDDTIIGDDGANRLDGAMGADTLVGNGGADTFVFAHAPGAASGFVHPNSSANVDTIFDFVSGEDKLEINAAAFGGGLAPGALPSDQFLVGSAAGDANDRFIYDQASGNLYFDADGSGGGAQVLMAILPNHDVIAATDFVIV